MDVSINPNISRNFARNVSSHTRASGRSNTVSHVFGNVLSNCSVTCLTTALGWADEARRATGRDQPRPFPPRAPHLLYGPVLRFAGQPGELRGTSLVHRAPSRSGHL